MVLLFWCHWVIQAVVVSNLDVFYVFIQTIRLSHENTRQNKTEICIKTSTPVMRFDLTIQVFEMVSNFLYSFTVIPTFIDLWLSLFNGNYAISSNLNCVVPDIPEY